MIELRKTAVYAKWFRQLRDQTARALIEVRVDRLQLGHVGDARSVGEGVSERRIHYSPGYRVYFVQKGSAVILLLCGGDKSDQARDIAQAKAMARDWET